jgi:hypothetical protein
MVSTTKQSGQAEECTVSKMSALKKEYRQLWEQMAELDQEWIRKHNELNEKQEARFNGLMDAHADELCDSISQKLVKRTIGYYEVEIEDEVQ